MAEYCDDGRIKVRRPPVWVSTGRYRAKPGKFIAVSNTHNLTLPQKADLYHNKASNLLFIATTDYQDPVVASILSSPPYNIPKDRMISNMGGSDIANLTPLLAAGIKRFNIDEPWHKRCAPGFVSQVDALLPPDGKLYTSEYYSRSCWSGLDHGQLGGPNMAHNTINHLIAEYSPVVSGKTKLGAHSKWEYVDGFGVWTNPRSHWTQLRDQLAGQGKFEHGWVQTIKTAYHIIGWGHYRASNEEMRLLFGHATNVGANTVFSYVENPGGQYAPRTFWTICFTLHIWQAAGSTRKRKVYRQFIAAPHEHSTNLVSYWRSSVLEYFGGCDALEVPR